MKSVVRRGLVVGALLPLAACFAGDEESETVGESSQEISGDQTVIITRKYNATIGDRLLTRDPREGEPFWRLEGPAFRLYDRPAPGRTPLLRCRINGHPRHFASTDLRCEGHVVEGPLGFVLQGAAPGAAPLMRCRNPNGFDHITTIDPGECLRAGYVIEGPQGFAFPPR